MTCNAVRRNLAAQHRSMLGWQGIAPFLCGVVHQPGRDHRIESFAHVTFMQSRRLRELCGGGKPLSNHQANLVTYAHEYN